VKKRCAAGKRAQCPGRRKKIHPQPGRFFDLSPCVDYTGMVRIVRIRAILTINDSVLIFATPLLEASDR
jgi:hypothetical protein